MEEMIFHDPRHGRSAGIDLSLSTMQREDSWLPSHSTSIPSLVSSRSVTSPRRDAARSWSLSSFLTCHVAQWSRDILT